MIIARSSRSSGPPCEGNQAGEAGRSPPFGLEAKERRLLDCERMSPNASEPVSASLHFWVRPVCQIG